MHALEWSGAIVIVSHWRECHTRLPTVRARPTPIGTPAPPSAHIFLIFTWSPRNLPLLGYFQMLVLRNLYERSWTLGGPTFQSVWAPRHKCVTPTV